MSDISDETNDGIVIKAPAQFPKIRINRWRVREGFPVSASQVILLYEVLPADDGPEDNTTPTDATIYKLKAQRVGVVKKRLYKDGATVKADTPLLELSACIHTTVIKDMCADCGADLRQNENGNQSEASVPMVHSIPDLKVTQKLAQKLGHDDTRRLLQDRKLVLLVDLDQTVIHTTNDNVPNNVKGIYHFQLYGPQSPWYHTRLRPGTPDFLERMSQFYELHICTFGARNYAHMIAQLLDPEGKFFSHRILSRDECFNATSKTDNLKALFPNGDSMVCIIDDREDVWNMASNLIQVKPYHFFQHTGDINAPPGLSKHELDGEGVDFKEIENLNVDDKEKTVDDKTTIDDKTTDQEETSTPTDTESSIVKTDESSSKDKVDSTTPISNTDENTNESNADATTTKDESVQDTDMPDIQETDNGKAITISEAPEVTPPKSVEEKSTENTETLEIKKVETPVENKEETKEINQATNAEIENKNNVEDIKNKAMDENKESVASTSTEENKESVTITSTEENKGSVATTSTEENKETAGTTSTEENNESVAITSSEENKESVAITSTEENKESVVITSTEENKESVAISSTEENKESVAISSTEENKESAAIISTEENKESVTTTSTEETIETTATTTVAEENTPKLKAPEDPANQIEIEDPDDYLLHLEVILKQIYNRFYSIYDDTKEIPDLKIIVPKIRSEVLRGCFLVFSGLVPTNMKLQQSRAYFIAKSLGAEVSQNIMQETTHLVAVTAGTFKVNAAKKSPLVKIVNANWLWSCAERWEHVEEVLFPLDRKMGSKQRQPPAHCHSPEHVVNYSDKSEISSSSSAQQNASEPEKFIDTINPLLSFSNADLADMNQEFDQFFDSDSSSEDEHINIENPPVDKTLRKRKREENEEERTRKFFTRSNADEVLATKCAKVAKNLDDKTSSEEEEDEEDEEMPSEKFRRGGDLPSDLEMGSDSNDGSDNDNNPDEEDDGDWNMMGAALEREFLGLED